MKRFIPDIIMASSEDDDASGERDRLMQSSSSNGRLSFNASSGTPTSKDNLEMGKMEEVFYYTDGAGGGPTTPNSAKYYEITLCRLLS